MNHASPEEHQQEETPTPVWDTPEPHIIDQHQSKEHGQNKCPKCGASDIALNIQSGCLQCQFCRHEFACEYPTDIVHDLRQLNDIRLGAGAQQIEPDAESIVTLKCQSCGAEVVISTDEAQQARCHWCRNTLSLNHAVPNGAVPDVVLPFKMTKEKAAELVEKFVSDRWFYAHTRFKEEFTTENIFGVYLPYMIVDVNCSVELDGEGEVLVQKYTVTRNKQEETRYDADAYYISRQFDFTVNDLTVEASHDKLQHQGSSNTKNIINSIMPFDTEKVVKWNANYIKGFHSEKRDVNVSDLRQLVYEQVGDIACEHARDTILKYDRGVRWDSVTPSCKGEQWISAYLPVWLYSYQRGERGKLFYSAVNARTGEVMGSVPINYFKLALVSLALLVVSGLAVVLVTGDFESIFIIAVLLCYPYYIYTRYTNQQERHWYEGETEAEKFNVRAQDAFNEHREELTDSRIEDMTHMPRRRGE